MSNPYGDDPYGHGSPEPGEASYQPYSPNPYGGGPTPYGLKAPTDGVSIAAFVAGLTCCAAPVAIILGGIGLARTKGERRTGRWAAITGLVLGIVGTLALVGFVVFVTFFAVNTTDPSRAEVGDCVDVDRIGVSDATLWTKECTESHDAEVVAVGALTAAEEDAFDEDDPAALCDARIASTEYADLDRDAYYVGIVIESVTVTEVGDEFLCYMEPRDGKLDAPLVD